MTRLFASLAATAIVLGALACGPAQAAPVDTGHLVAELVSAQTSVSPGGTVRVALRQKIDKRWHTYWRNSGDSGEATTLAWTLPQGWRAGEIVWPAPSRQPTGPLMNYGYAGEVLLPVVLTAPAQTRPGDVAKLSVEANFLVCEEICIPEQATLTLELPVTATPAAADPRWGAAIARAVADAPKPAGLAAVFAPQGEKVALAVTGPALAGTAGSGAYFYPFERTVIDHAQPQPAELGAQGLTLTLTPGTAFQGGASPASLAGVLSVDGRAYEITATPGPAPADAAGLGAPKLAAPAAGPGLGLPLAAAFALLGGLLLNLMPCVFPVLAMKAASLAGHAHEPAQARRQGVAYGLGVLATFLALAGALIALKMAGAAIGWGFQLQSPPVVAALALLMLAVALNLSGVFEVGSSLQGVGAPLAARSGTAGAFLTGALAVVVAAPCTAPFMAPALGWALTQGPVAALSVFLALGLGFATPFVAIAFAPALLARLPRPGAWMEMLRRVLAFPMYGAAAWLAWVLALQAGDTALAGLLAAAVALAFAGWLAGHAQRRRMAGKAASGFTGLALAACAAALALALWPALHDVAPASQASAGGSGAPYEAYSPQRLAQARAEGRPVFVNFTAAWCVTCQVNERVALSRAAVAQAFARTGAVYLKADWTRKDAEIAAELGRYGRAGVPLYLMYDAKGGAPRILPQILTEGGVIRALDRAKKG